MKEDRPYRRCPACRQLFDSRVDAEVIHHMRSGHKRMAGIPDDGLETIPLDFDGPPLRSWCDPAPGEWTPHPPAPISRDARKGRRKKSDFQ
jgi:hypothetical protein